MSTKSNPGKKPAAKPGAKPAADAPSASGKTRASADSVKKMKPKDAAASGKRNAPGGKPSGPAAPAARPSAQLPPSLPTPTPSQRAGRMSKRGAKKMESLRTNLSADIAGLDKVVEREKKREEFAKAQATGGTIKTTDRASRETRKVYAILAFTVLAIGGLFGFIIFRGWLMPPSAEELAEVNGWCATKMNVALKKISAAQIQRDLRGKELTEDEKRRLIRNKLADQIALMEAKNEKEIEAVNDSAISKSREELMEDQRALAILKTLKDAYGRDWQIEFGADHFVIVKSLGANNQDDSGPGAHEAKPKTDDVVCSAYLPFQKPPAYDAGLASKNVPQAPVIDLTDQSYREGAPPPPDPTMGERARPENSDEYQKLVDAREAARLSGQPLPEMPEKAPGVQPTQPPGVRPPGEDPRRR